MRLNRQGQNKGFLELTAATVFGLVMLAASAVGVLIGTTAVQRKTVTTSKASIFYCNENCVQSNPDQCTSGLVCTALTNATLCRNPNCLWDIYCGARDRGRCPDQPGCVCPTPTTPRPTATPAPTNTPVPTATVTACPIPPMTSAPQSTCQLINGRLTYSCSWGPVPMATEYTYYVARPGAQVATGTVAATAPTSIILTQGIESGIAYNCQVIPKNNCGSPGAGPWGPSVTCPGIPAPTATPTTICPGRPYTDKTCGGCCAEKTGSSCLASCSDSGGGLCATCPNCCGVSCNYQPCGASPTAVPTPTVTPVCGRCGESCCTASPACYGGLACQAGTQLCVNASCSWNTTDCVCAAVPTPTPTLPLSCQTLLNKIQAAMSKQCGEALYDKYADINNDRVVNAADASLFAANLSETWCAGQLMDNTNPCTGAPVLSVSPATLAFTATEGGSNPTAQNVTITNSGGGTLTWTAVRNANWITLNPASGSTTSSSNLQVGVNIAGLVPQGPINGEITITNTVAGTPPSEAQKIVTVTLTVTASGGTGASIAPFDFNHDDKLNSLDWSLLISGWTSGKYSALDASNFLSAWAAQRPQ